MTATPAVCAGCDLPMVSLTSWNHQPALHATHVPHAANGDCRSCYSRRRNGTLDQVTVGGGSALQAGGQQIGRAPAVDPGQALAARATVCAYLPRGERGLVYAMLAIPLPAVTP